MNLAAPRGNFTSLATAQGRHGQGRRYLRRRDRLARSKPHRWGSPADRRGATTDDLDRGGLSALPRRHPRRSLGGDVGRGFDPRPAPRRAGWPVPVGRRPWRRHPTGDHDPSHGEWLSPGIDAQDQGRASKRAARRASRRSAHGASCRAERRVLARWPQEGRPRLHRHERARRAPLPGWISNRLGVRTKAARRARVRLHDTRHTAATLMLAAGIQPEVVREMLGHSHGSITLGIYGHVPPTMGRDACGVVSEPARSQGLRLLLLAGRHRPSPLPIG